MDDFESLMESHIAELDKPVPKYEKAVENLKKAASHMPDRWAYSFLHDPLDHYVASAIPMLNDHYAECGKKLVPVAELLLSCYLDAGNVENTPHGREWIKLMQRYAKKYDELLEKMIGLPDPHAVVSMD